MITDSTSVRIWLCAVALLLGGCNLPWLGGKETGDILLSGTLEARETALSFQVKGRIAALQVDEGDNVAVDAPVAQLDSRDYQLALDQARGQRDAARAALAELQAGTRKQELAVAKATLERAKSQRDYNRSELARVTHLSKQHLASQEQLDQARLALRVAEASVEEARQQLDLLQEGPRREDIDKAQAELSAAEAVVKAAEQNLSYTRLVSPVKGVVSVRMAEAGEVVAAGQPVFKVEELATPWVRAYLPETQLARVKLGQSAEVRVDGLPDKVFQGRLTYISPEAEFTPKTVQTQQLRVDLVYRVKIQVDNSQGLLKVGMPADVTLAPAQ
jgi:HlyD family secretion protein